MIKIAVFTTTRGDMAILSPLLLKMRKDKKIKPLLFVGGTHLNENFGKTVNEIKSNKLKIEGFFKINMLQKYFFNILMSVYLSFFKNIA